MVGRENPETRRASDIRVIITAYQTEKVNDDHPYNADSARGDFVCFSPMVSLR
jgi:hypothetical protein